MAKVKFSALISEMRGKLNGSVFTKNRSGAALRNKVTPVNRATVSQGSIKALFTHFNQKWRSLSDSDMKAWNAAVEDFQRTNIFGDNVKPTGMNLYTELNVNLALVNGVEISVPPLPGPVEGVAAMTLDIDSTVGAKKFDIDLTPDPTTAGVTNIVYATRCYSPGKSFVKGSFRMIATIPGGTASPYDALAEWENKFGKLVKDQLVSVKLVPVNFTTGQKFRSGNELSSKVK